MLLLAFVVIVILGCSHQSSFKTMSGYGSGHVPPEIKWSGHIYHLDFSTMDFELKNKQIAKRLPEAVGYQVTGNIQQSWVGKPYDVYSIYGIKTEDAIAIYIDKKYYKMSLEYK